MHHIQYMFQSEYLAVCLDISLTEAAAWKLTKRDRLLEAVLFCCTVCIVGQAKG